VSNHRHVVNGLPVMVAGGIALPPYVEHVVVAADEAFGAPRGEDRRRHAVAVNGGFVVVGQVDGRGGYIRDS